MMYPPYYSQLIILKLFSSSSSSSSIQINQIKPGDRPFPPYIEKQMDGKDWMRKYTISTDHDDDHQSMHDEEGILEMVELKRGPWTAEEDLLLINYIANHGEGRWNSLALSAGLKRTGKSCRLRWLNYLRPDVRRGNITPQEQLLILQLHFRWGNRWSKIAQYLPGRTDNEIKNYWRTRVQKQAKQLRCDVNSKLFKDTMRYIWMPRLAEKIRAAAATTTTTVEETSLGTTTTTFNINTADLIISGQQQQQQQQQQGLPVDVAGYINTISYTSNTPEYSSTITKAASSDSFGTSQQDYNNYPLHQGMDDLSTQINYSNSFTSPSVSYFNQPKQGLLENHDFGGSNSSSSSSSCSRHEEQQSDIGWLGGGGEDNGWENFWNPEDIWFLHQQL